MPIEWNTRRAAMFGALAGTLVGLLLHWSQLFQSAQSLRALTIVGILAAVGAGISAGFSAIRNLFVV